MLHTIHTGSHNTSFHLTPHFLEPFSNLIETASKIVATFAFLLEAGRNGKCFSAHSSQYFAQSALT